MDGRFQVESLLGKGGQGVVFRVKHLEWNNDFALKIPLPGALASESSRERYLKEAQTWIRMGVHPHIVRCWFVLPIGELPALFLDLVGGGTLEDKIKQGALVPGRWEKILQVLLELADGLSYAHSKGVVHRDLKPENLMIHDHGRLSITDFGLVKTLGGRSSDEETTDSLAPEEAMGTPRYGSPEQWVAPEAVGPASDIYSFGVILYELLTGARPFDPPDRSCSSIELINRHITEQPPDPYQRVSNIPRPLVDLCLQCLAKRPEERPGTATEILERLSAVMQSTYRTPYLRPAPIPAGDRPDLLNNAAASLYALGKWSDARALLLKGLMIEAGHPECLYNLVQLDRREGKIDRTESFRRLRRAQANFQLGLLYIEEGNGLKAMAALERTGEDRRSGFFYRIQGDALMYAGRFPAAVEAYQQAHRLMPNDLPSKFRLELARRKTVRHQGDIYFPSDQSCYTSRAPSTLVTILPSPDSSKIIGVDPKEIVLVEPDSNRLVGRKSRPDGAERVLRSWSSPARLLLQDSNGVESWDMETLSLHWRVRGRVLATTKELKNLGLLTERGVVLVSGQESRTLRFPPDIPPSSRVLLSLGQDDGGFCMAIPDGRLATVDRNYQVEPLSWPPPFPEPGALSHLLLADRTVYLVAGSVVHALDMEQRRFAWLCDLGFLPEDFVLDLEGRSLVLSSSSACAVLTKRGKIVYRGPGPCAVDSEKRHALFWMSGTLSLFRLHPFHRVRTWAETIGAPLSIRFATDGRRALTTLGDGEYKLWEVDEPNRVYKRSLLVTQGQSYQDLIASFEVYTRSFQRACQLFADKEYVQSHQALQEARAVSGFLQAPEALNLQWSLCRRLQNKGLEAIWERLYLSDLVSGRLASDGGHLLLVQRDKAELHSLFGPRIELKVCHANQRELLGGCFLNHTSSEPMVAVFSRCGFLQSIDGEGRVINEVQLPSGPFRSVSFEGDCAVALTQKGLMVALDLKRFRPLSATQIPAGQALEHLFLLNDGKALVVTDRSHLMLEFSRGTLKPGLPLELEKFPGQITCVRDDAKAKVRLTGFSDGTLLFSHLKSGQPLFGINQENGPVSGACLHPESALGVSVSEHGGMTLFDLAAGRAMERFVAHVEGVVEVSLSENGRYLTTRSRTGQFRLWEISWGLSERLGSRMVDWLPKSRGLGHFFKS